MLDKGWIVSANELLIGSSKKEYVITDVGKTIVKNEQARIKHILKILERMSDE